jgi:hypothetical protein
VSLLHGALRIVNEARLHVVPALPQRRHALLRKKPGVRLFADDSLLHARLLLGWALLVHGRFVLSSVPRRSSKSVR